MDERQTLNKQILGLKSTVLEYVVPLPVSGKQTDAWEHTEELYYNLQSRIEVSSLAYLPKPSPRQS